MEITYFKETGRTFTHDVTIIINDKILEYTVDSVKRNGKYYTAGYHKKQITKLKTSERKKIKRYFENDFLERAEDERNNEARGLHLHDVIARYSIDEDAEYNIAKLLEYKIRLSDENEDGLTHDEYYEYQELEDWFNGL